MAKSEDEAAKSEDEAAQVRGWYGEGTALTPRMAGVMRCELEAGEKRNNPLDSREGGLKFLGC